MKANFKQISVEVAFDVFQELDIAKQVGNFIHANTSDIGLDDIARTIYHSEGEVDIPDEYIPLIKAIFADKNCNMLAAIKKALLAELDKKD
jgi:hypothetical protein